MTTKKHKYFTPIMVVGSIVAVILYLIVAKLAASASRDVFMMTNPAAIQQALKANPNDEPALRGLAFQYKIAHNYTRAITTYRHLLVVDPGAVDRHYKIGMCFQRTGDTQNTVLQFRPVVQLNGMMERVSKKTLPCVQSQGNP